MVKTTFPQGKPSKELDDINSCYVFRPEKARGENGVALKEFLGIGDIRELLIQIINHGSEQDIALFPICIPRSTPKYPFMLIN